MKWEHTVLQSAHCVDSNEFTSAARAEFEEKKSPTINEIVLGMIMIIIVIIIDEA